MQSSKSIRHAAYAAPSGPRLTWSTARQAAALVAAFLFVSAIVCGIL